MLPSVLDLCCGTGGQAVGFEATGYRHEALIHADRWACDTIRQNRLNRNVVQVDLCDIDTTGWHDVGVVAGGLSCLCCGFYVEKQEEAGP